MNFLQENFTLKPEVKEKIVTEAVQRWVEKNMIHCNDHEGVNCIQTSDEMNSNGNTTTEIVILVVIIIVVLLLLGGCVYRSGTEKKTKIGVIIDRVSVL